MIEMRLFAVIGMLVVSVTSLVLVLAVYALGRWIGRLRAAPTTRMVPPRNAVPSPNAAETEHAVRTRQAAWRLRC